MEIIPATEGHIPRIVALWKEFEEYHGTLDPYFSTRDDGHIIFEKYIKESIESKDALVLVALDGENVVGACIARMDMYPPVYKNENYGYVGFMAVKDNCQRQGVGEQMLFEIFKWFKSCGIHRVELRVRVKNELGYSFWKKHGFRDYEHNLFKDL
jgi:ribosomal protein S18 acetylase RimI-like enzyme